MGRGPRLDKEIEWRQRLARFGRAGTSVVQFCADEGVSTPSFYAWRRRLSDETDTLQAAEKAASSSSERHDCFAPVRVIGQAHGGNQVTVWLCGGMRLEIPLADAKAVATLLEALVHADAERAGGRPC
jgi:hypothetical protein